MEIVSTPSQSAALDLLAAFRGGTASFSAASTQFRSAASFLSHDEGENERTELLGEVIAALAGGGVQVPESSRAPLELLEHLATPRERVWGSHWMEIH